ncbi:hypothetical protein MTX78_15195 [Hymenobacter tibetensis]|uniref:Uncharacterized protein n=1 Tax=Hymenobacter tibetensis TaxID=497967 RepID=A0ABY4CWB1_9BACT|nr:hypothetical protein [Hymenobacter tibetensis]UOG73470.1 hypothetical protein MTX78_15195 [Hymenobacter tibetensis]
MNSLRITGGVTVLTATPADNPTARDFVTLLLLTTRPHDYGVAARIERLS